MIAVLNSTVFTFVLNSLDTKIGSGEAYRHYKYNMEKLCLPNVDVSMFDYEIKAILNNKDVFENSKSINRKIYKIYELNEDEIQYLEKNLK